MASTLQTEPAAVELLSCILAGDPYPDALLRRAIVEDEGRSLFSVVVERLADLFEARLCDEYARLIARVIELLRPEFRAIDLLRRYERVRQVRRCEKRAVRNIFVLSRVTIGADVAVTSVIMNALSKRYPEASIHFVGSQNNAALFKGRNIHHVQCSYPRAGSLPERLNQASRFALSDSIVVDPDSRLTQLGMLPVCDEENYFFFESRAYGGDSRAPLPVLASRWTREVFGVDGRAWIAPEAAHMPCDAAVSFGVGGNERKRVGDAFEEQVLRALVRRGLSVMVDKGAGVAETERIDRMKQRVDAIHTFQGPFAPFASMISQARLYVGYDSAGQHVAAACGVPLLTVFAGFPSERMFQRWRPHGPGPAEVVQVRAQDPETLLAQTVESIEKLIG